MIPPKGHPARAATVGDPAPLMPSLAGDRWRWNRRRGAAGQPAPLVPSPPNGRGRWYV